jgi:hypothetical protein
MKTLPKVWILIFLISAAVLAFLLRPWIDSLLIRPLVYAVRAGGLAARSISQQTCWLVLVGALAGLALSTALGMFSRLRWRERQAASRRGPVEELASTIRKARGGRYFKWLVANRLGLLAREFLRGRGEEDPKTWKVHLSGAGWQPPEEVQEYLEAGLEQISVQETRRNLFGIPEPSPLDLDPRKVVAYLEEQMEMHNSEHNHDEQND